LWHEWDRERRVALRLSHEWDREREKQRRDALSRKLVRRIKGEHDS
jgi:hypothetical protein